MHLMNRSGAALWDPLWDLGQACGLWKSVDADVPASRTIHNSIESERAVEYIRYEMLMNTPGQPWFNSKPPMFFNFNHVPVVLLSCILAVLLARIEAKLVSPPSSLDLIYPSADTVPFNSSIAVGLSDNKDSVYIGLARNITISITLPNGTETDLLTSFGDCVVPSISGEAFTSVDQEGT